MRMTSSKCVLQQRHLLGYEPEPRDPNPNPRTHPNPNPILPNRNKVFERKQKRHRNIGSDVNKAWRHKAKAKAKA